MTEKELKLLKKIPKRYRKHIISLTISKSGEYNKRGQEIHNYRLIYDNEDEHIFENQEYMIWLLKEYTNDDGYFVAP